MSMHILRKHPLAATGAIIGTVLVMGWIAIGYFGVHLLFLDDEVSQAAPTFDAAPAAVDDSSTPGGTPSVAMEFDGSFANGAHPTTGRAVVLGNGSEQRFLRLEDFATDNGPDLNVYLVNSSAGGVADVIDLGDLAGNIGDQNYEIPAGVDLTVYDEVVIWCVRFGVGFGSAALSPT
jgi:hypothetical protein